ISIAWYWNWPLPKVEQGSPGAPGRKKRGLITASLPSNEPVPETACGANTGAALRAGSTPASLEESPLAWAAEPARRQAARQAVRRMWCPSDRRERMCIERHAAYRVLHADGLESLEARVPPPVRAGRL